MNNKIVIVALGAAIIGAVFWMLTAEKDTEVVKKVDKMMLVYRKVVKMMNCCRKS